MHKRYDLDVRNRYFIYLTFFLELFDLQANNINGLG